MELFYFVFIALYDFLLLAMKKSWEKKGEYTPKQKKEFQVALLIPFRNEFLNLPDLLLNLEKIIPPSVEVYFIDDHSEDKSKEIIDSFFNYKSLPNWKLIENSGIGKKAALTTGMGHTKAEIIMTTDADCQLPENWIAWMSQPFQYHHVQLVAGPVVTKSRDGFFAKFQQIEWASILLLTQFLFLRKQPLICSGANLAYRKSAFVKVKGYLGNEGYFSGDDEFLLKKVIRNFGNRSAIYLNREEVLVKTNPLSNIAAFVQQRVRWGSKWKLHGSIHTFSAVVSYLVALLEIGSISLLFGDLWSILTFVVFWVLKISFEKMVLGHVLSDFKIHLSLINYVKTSFLHPLYILVVGPLSVIKKYSWKGRNSFN